MIFGTQRSPRAIYFGAGQRAALPGIVLGFGRKVLICSDERLRQDPKLIAMLDALIAENLEVRTYEGTRPELPLECIIEAADLATGFEPDVVIGIGGGSCLDIAKLVSLVLRHGRDIQQFYGEFKVPGPIVPVIAIPTTSGTGSEVTPVAVLGDPARVSKVGISSPYLIPEVALCDPELTLTCPPGLTAVAGADALTHAIEAFTAIRRAPDPLLPLRQVFIGKNQQSDDFARLAIPALATNLASVVADGSDVAAREQVMYGALTAGLSFGVAGTAAAHALQYPIGALTKTAHGVGVAVLMPFVMEFNRSAIKEQLAEIALLFGVPRGSLDEMSSSAIDVVSKLFSTIGIPENLSALGVPEEKLDWIAEQSMQSVRLVTNNPVPLDAKAMLAIATAAFHGDRASLHQNS